MNPSFIGDSRWSGVDDLCSEWESERKKHPFYVENLSEEQIQSCWDESSANYSGNEYSNIRMEIVDILLKEDIIGPDSTIIDIGCGPGLYDVLFAPHVKSVMCVDGSPGMIRRLKMESEMLGITNIDSQIAFWEDFDSEEKYDVVFTSLCPALNNPQSILRMESYCIWIQI